MIPLVAPPPPPPIAVEAPRWADALRPPSLRARSERVDPGEEPSDFNVGDWEIKVRLGFSGNSYGPQTFVTAFFNWFELQLAADHGILEVEYLSFGIGVEAWIGRPWIPEAVADLTSTEGQSLAWSATTRGVAGRATLHYTWLSSFDPYAVVLVGPTLDGVRGAWDDGRARGVYRSAGMRVGAGGGISVVSDDRVMGGVELRYLVATRFRSGQGVEMEDSDGGNVVDTFSVGRPQRPPRGLSWVAFVGVRL